MLSEVADGVWVRQSAWVWSNAVVVRADDGLVLVDPGIDGDDLAGSRTTWMRSAGRWSPGSHAPALGPPALAPPLRRRAALRHGRLRAGGRWGARAGAADGGGERVGDPPRAGRARHRAARGRRPGAGHALEHEAHATGHAAVLLADRGVLLAGDMLSDVLIPSSTRAAPARWAPT